MSRFCFMQSVPKTSIFCLFSVVIFFSVYHEAAGMKCWVCDSLYDPHCGDPFDNSTFAIADCEQMRPQKVSDNMSTMCRKHVYKSEGKWRYIRNCGFSGDPDIEGAEMCSNKDGCNGVPAFGATDLTIMITVFTSMASLLS